MANRFTQLQPTDFSKIELFTPNFAALDAALKGQQQKYDITQEASEKMPQYIANSKEQKGALKYREKMHSLTDNIADIYSKDGLQAGNKYLSSAMRQIKRDWQAGGEAFALQSNYDSYAAYKKSINTMYEKGTINAEKKNWLLSKSVQDFGGTQYDEGSYNTFSGISAAHDVELAKQASDLVAGWESDKEIGGTIKMSNGYWRTKTGEKVSAKEVYNAVLPQLLNDPKSRAYMRQEAAMRGLSGADADAYVNQLATNAAAFAAQKEGFYKEDFKDVKDWKLSKQYDLNNGLAIAQLENELSSPRSKYFASTTGAALTPKKANNMSTNMLNTISTIKKLNDKIDNAYEMVEGKKVRKTDPGGRYVVSDEELNSDRKKLAQHKRNIRKTQSDFKSLITKVREESPEVYDKSLKKAHERYNKRVANSVADEKAGRGKALDWLDIDDFENKFFKNGSFAHFKIDDVEEWDKSNLPGVVTSGAEIDLQMYKDVYNGMFKEHVNNGNDLIRTHDFVKGDAVDERETLLKEELLDSPNNFVDASGMPLTEVYNKTYESEKRRGLGWAGRAIVPGEANMWAKAEIDQNKTSIISLPNGEYQVILRDKSNKELFRGEFQRNAVNDASERYGVAQTAMIDMTTKNRVFFVDPNDPNNRTVDIQASINNVGNQATYPILARQVGYAKYPGLGDEVDAMNPSKAEGTITKTIKNQGDEVLVVEASHSDIGNNYMNTGTVYKIGYKQPDGSVDFITRLDGRGKVFMDAEEIYDALGNHESMKTVSETLMHQNKKNPKFKTQDIPTNE